ncbi:6878_t:CDS:2, partial [Funneliformis geosporum]
ETEDQNASNLATENGSIKQNAINIGTAQGKDSDRSAGSTNIEANNNDKVREILEARLRISNVGGSATVENTNATQQLEPRENMILQAITFLSSPIVRNSDEDKKLKFLFSKGLTQAEIDIAKDRVNKEEPLAPPVPPRTYHQMVVARTPLWKRLIFILLITGAFSAAMIAMIKTFLGPAVTAIIFAKQQLHSHQVNLFRRFNESLSTFLSLNKSTSRNEISTPPALLAPLATDLSELTERLSIHQQTLSKPDAISDLQLSLTSLAAYLSSNVYSYSRSPPNDRDSPVSQIRSEIRSLKSLMVNRRNFPKIPPVPAYSAQSQISSTQPPQQEVDTSNENVE